MAPIIAAVLTVMGGVAIAGAAMFDKPHSGTGEIAKSRQTTAVTRPLSMQAPVPAHKKNSKGDVGAGTPMVARNTIGVKESSGQEVRESGGQETMLDSRTSRLLDSAVAAAAASAADQLPTANGQRPTAVIATETASSQNGDLLTALLAFFKTVWAKFSGITSWVRSLPWNKVIEVKIETGE